MNQHALIVVDYQNDFAEGGSLAVPWARSLAPFIQETMLRTKASSWLIIATRDWHPDNTVHFAPGWRWPVHCVAGTEWAKYIDGIDPNRIDQEIFKGYKNSDDGYSGFEGTTELMWKRETGFEVLPSSHSLLEVLRQAKVHTLEIVWLATDFCVYATARDAIENWFDTRILTPGIRAVNVPWLPSWEDRLRELAERWAKIL